MTWRFIIVLSVILASAAILIQNDGNSSRVLITTFHKVVDFMFNSHLYNKLKNGLFYLNIYGDNLKKDDTKLLPIVRYGNDRLFTKEELSYYKGVHDHDDNSPGLYLAILGQVYDVAKGDRHYGPGCAYHCFAGVDGTKAFITGEFTEKGLIDDVTGLLPEQMLELENWIDFYAKTYDYKGKVIGNFYDEKGQPTASVLEAKHSMEEAHLKKKTDDEHRQWFPPCNSAHTSEGGWVSCSDKSGGIKRDWVGVPRKYHIPGKPTPRCVCVRTTGPPYDDPDSDLNHGDLDNPHLEEYQGCDPMAQFCKIS